jgi:hypothetical protein
MLNTQSWTFGNFIEEIVLMSEIIEIPGYKAKRDDLIKEVWKRFPAECEALGLTDGLGA